MKRKIICILIITFILLTSFPTLISTNSTIIKNQIITINNPEYVIDQKQENYSTESFIHSHNWYAQSFKPSMTPLTKIDIMINKQVLIENPLELSIRSDLTGSELTYIPLTSDQIPYYTNWIEFDFPDIEVEPEETYYIVIRTNSPSGSSYRWKNNYNPEKDDYNRGEQWFSQDYGAIWEPMEEDAYVDSVFRTYSYISYSDLECNGFFNWTDIQPGETVQGSFTLINNGTSFSYLNWKILQWPSWGEWSFNPSNGQNLKPEDGQIIVAITVEAPHSNIPDTYSGTIKIINEDDEEDFCLIQTTLITPIIKESTKLINYKYYRQRIFLFPFLTLYL